MPPPGLLRLGGELLRRGWEVRLEDLAFRLAKGELRGDDEMCADAARWLQRDGAPEVLGLSTMGATLPAAIEIARLVRECSPSTFIVLGGPGTHGSDAALLERFDFISAIVRGEGEETLPELLERLASGDSLDGVAGLTWRASTGEVVREADRPPIADLGQLADYARSLLPPLSSYKAITGFEDGLTPIDSGRGCVYDCSFCTIGRYWGRRSRTLPVERLIREVLEVRELESAKSAYLCHDIFGADREYAIDFCESLIALGAPVPWECRARVDHIDEELSERMGRAGCYRVLFGIESGDPALRNAHDKHLDAKLDVLGRIEACSKNGVIPILSIILGLPGEDEDALARSLDFAAQAGLASGVQLSFHLVNPQPGCGLGEQYGADSSPLEGIPPDMALGAGETKPERELIAAHPDLFSTWSLLTSLPGGEVHLRNLHEITKRVPDLLMRYPRTFLAHCRRTNERALDVLRRLQSFGRSFEAFTRIERDDLLDGIMAWEQCVLRAPLRRANSSGRLYPDRVLVNFEPRELTDWLRGKTQQPPVEQTVHLAILASERGVRTNRISADVWDVLEQAEALEEQSPETTAAPELSEALAQLVSAGVIG